MPELPEVETVRRGLEQVKGKTIKSIELRDITKSIQITNESLKDKSIKNIDRIGKYLLIHLTNNDQNKTWCNQAWQSQVPRATTADIPRAKLASSSQTLISHLRMTGQYIPTKNQIETKQKQNSHTRVLFHFTDNSSLLYNDQRKFGTMELLETKEELAAYFQKRKISNKTDALLIDDKTLITNLKSKPNTSIKTALLDQSIIAGLGNIYAMELCFLAKVHPNTKVKNTKNSTLKTIHKHIKPLLNKALEYKGTTFDGKYVTTSGDAGEFSNFLKVYGKQDCQECNAKIEKTKINGRGTYHCPKCQK